jgi:hypothetical protein
VVLLFSARFLQTERERIERERWTTQRCLFPINNNPRKFRICIFLMALNVCMLQNKLENQQANSVLYSSLAKRERKKKIGCCWKNKRSVSVYIILRYMYKSGYTRKDRRNRKYNIHITAILC